MPESDRGSERDLIEAARKQFEAVPPARFGTRTQPYDSAIAALTEVPALPAIQGYAITREVHRGGQGVVYEATQSSTGRRVALKVLRAGPLASAAERARFEREVHILGRLDHPNIVGVLDRGVFAGHVYLVMDYIDGPTLDLHVEALRAADDEPASGEFSSISGSTLRRGSHAARRARRREIVALFARVADAVHAAHLHGVIHRDLKPSNIRVDSRGEPHVLDFGLAELTNDPGAEAAMTQTGQFLGSLPWASPEQARGDVELDLRTDVYSLGVLLYEMLTGVFPYAVVGPLSEVLSRIQQAAPASMAAQRRDLAGDLDTIVLRCLQKDPARRYQSAGDLARDLRHYLDNEPIEARRDSFAYVLRSQLRRYRWPISVAAAFVVTLAAGLVASVVLWRQAVVERDWARLARQDAEQRRADAEAVTRMLQSAISFANPLTAKSEFSVRDLLDVLAGALDNGKPLRPSVEAGLRGLLGSAYRALGDEQPARMHLMRLRELADGTLGPGHPAGVRARLGMGMLADRDADFVAAEGDYRAALALARQPLAGDRDALTDALALLGANLVCQGRYDEAQTVLIEATDRAREPGGGVSEGMALALHSLGLLFSHAGRSDQAEGCYREALAEFRATQGRYSTNIAASLLGLAGALLDQGQLDEAEPLAREALRMYLHVFGSDSPLICDALERLALVHQSRRDFAAAEELLGRSLALQRRVGPDNPGIAETLNNLGSCRISARDWPGAIACLTESLERLRARNPRDSMLAVGLQNLAIALYSNGDAVAAERSLAEAYGIGRETYGPAEPMTLHSLESLVYVRERLADFGGSLAAARELRARREQRFGPGAPEVRAAEMLAAHVLASEAEAALDCGDGQGVRRAAEESAALCGEAVGPLDWRTARAGQLLGAGEALCGTAWLGAAWMDEGDLLLRSAGDAPRSVLAAAAEYAERAAARGR